jgi:hypothetical protein
MRQCVNGVRRGEVEKVVEVGLSTNLQGQGHGDRDKEGTGGGGAVDMEEEEADEEGEASKDDVAFLNSTKEERYVVCGVWCVVCSSEQE